MRKKILTGSAILCVLSVCFFSFGCSPKAEYVDYGSAGDGKSVRVAIISDTQLPPSADADGYLYEQHLLKALTYYKNRGIDALMFAGDMCENGTEYAYDSFMRVYNYVFGEEKPINLFIMGNHDYWLADKNPSASKMQKLFQKKTGESPWSHKVINGYHFINFSPAESSAAPYDKKLEWAKEQLDAAVADDPSKPVFIQTHHNPEGTIYGSEEWGAPQLKELFDQYPQLVAFSGHSHFSLVDERSIMQENFTAIQTQSLAYIELETGKENGSVPSDAEKFPMGLYMTVENNRVSIERISFADGKSPAIDGANWTIDYNKPAGERFVYKADRAETRIAPYFSAGASITQISENGDNFVTFGAAKHPDFVHSYVLKFYDADGKLFELPIKEGDGWIYKSEFYYFSDFYKGRDAMSDTVKFKLPKLPRGSYNLEITAVESFGKTSETTKKGQIIIQ